MTSLAVSAVALAAFVALIALTDRPSATLASDIGDLRAAAVRLEGAVVEPSPDQAKLRALFALCRARLDLVAHRADDTLGDARAEAHVAAIAGALDQIEDITVGTVEPGDVMPATSALNRAIAGLLSDIERTADSQDRWRRGGLLGASLLLAAGGLGAMAAFFTSGRSPAGDGPSSRGAPTVAGAVSGGRPSSFAPYSRGAGGRAPARDAAAGDAAGAVIATDASSALESLAVLGAHAVEVDRAGVVRVVLEPRGRVRGASLLLGASDVGARYADLVGAHASEAEHRVCEAVRAVLEGGEPVDWFDYAVTGDGAPRWLSVGVWPSAAGGALVMHQEVTRRRAAEAEREAAHRATTRNEVLRPLAHRLKTPLTSILGFTYFLRRGSAGMLSDEQRDQIEEILAASQRMLVAIDEALDPPPPPDNAPADDTPADDTPADATPADDTPADATPPVEGSASGIAYADLEEERTRRR